MLKVLPKFHGARSKLGTPLKALLAWSRDPESPELKGVEELVQVAETTDEMMTALSGVTYAYPRTAERALRMLRDLYTEGFTTFG